MHYASFIEDLAAVFGPNLDEAHGKRTVGTPFPEGLILTKSSTPEEGEVDRNIARGYQRLVGSLLWCVRHVSPICAYGCSQLCKLMSLGTTSPPKARSVVLLVRGAKWMHEELGYLSRYWCTTTSNWVHEVTPEPFKVPPRPLNSNLTPP